MSDIEKAKEHIKNLANDYKCYDNTISFEEALALNEALQNPCKICDYFAEDNPSYCRMTKIEGKAGRWILWTDDRKDYCKCSECGYGEEGEVYFGDTTPYCPVCGRKLEGV